MADVAILRNVGGLVFDATLKEAHTSEIEVTRNPIETGADVADHMYVKPKKVTISAGVTDDPLYVSTNDLFTGTSRTQAAFDLLVSLQESGEPFDIQTGLRLYQSMMCLSIRTEQDKDTTRVLFFEAEFEEVRIVSTQTVTYPPRKVGPTKRQASQTVQKGQQQGSQVTDTTKKGSLLAMAAGILKGGK